jgi:hypothetical protein
MRVALDAKRYVDLCKGVAATLALLEEAEAIMLPFVALHARDKHFDQLPQIVRV